MIAARLLVSGESATGDAVVRVAHKALLSHWPLAREIVIASRSFLETRARAGRCSPPSFWRIGSGTSCCLPAGGLAESRKCFCQGRDEVEDQVVVYVETSLMALTIEAGAERRRPSALHRGGRGRRSARRLGEAGAGLQGA